MESDTLCENVDCCNILKILEDAVLSDCPESVKDEIINYVDWLVLSLQSNCEKMLNSSLQGCGRPYHVGTGFLNNNPAYILHLHF